MPTNTITRPPVDERTAAITATETAWTDFRAAVRAGAGSAILESYLPYHRARRAVLDRVWFPPQTGPTPPPCPGDDVWRHLRDEHAFLTGWAPVIRSGHVEGNAANPGVREITAEERSTYRERAEAYAAALATYHQQIAAYCAFRGLPEPGHPGPNGAGWAGPAIPPLQTPMRPVYPLEPAVLPGGDDFSSALSAALSAGE